MEESLTLKERLLVTLYQQGVRGLRGQLIAGLPKRTAEWTQLARDAVSDWQCAERTTVIHQLLEPGFVEHHPRREALVECLQEVLSDGSGDERVIVARFVGENLRLFPVHSDAFQLKVMGLQTSVDPPTAVAGDDLLEKMGIDLRDPALLGDTHDSLQL